MVRYRPAIGSTEMARRLRRNPTDAEIRMWRILRECFPEARFRRQVPIRSFVTDFCSHRARLVVEVDGGQHDDFVDARRSAAIEAEGYTILRFWNHDVFGNRDGVAAALEAALHQRHPHPNPPPSRGREFTATESAEVLWKGCRACPASTT